MRVTFKSKGQKKQGAGQRKRGVLYIVCNVSEVYTVYNLYSAYIVHFMNCVPFAKQIQHRAHDGKTKHIG